MIEEELKEESVENPETLSNEESNDQERLAAVRAVELTAYRNYRHISLDLYSGFNVLCGPNAQGKTNFLEALYLLSTTTLLRGQKDEEAVYDGESRAVVSAELFETNTQIGIEITRGAPRKAFLNGLKLKRAADLLGRLPCVCIGSLDMALVQGEPAGRRLFLDTESSALSASYLRHLGQYKRALEQRNALLRSAKERSHAPNAYEPWEHQLATSGTALRKARLKYLEWIIEPMREAHALMGSGEQIEPFYKPHEPIFDEELLFAAYEEARGKDLARGYTTVGPHRDDFSLLIEGRDARLFGSQGQQRTAVISLKMGAFQAFRDVKGVRPLLLLDDILSDLDESRRQKLVKIVLERAGQAVLTCTEASAAGPEILSRAAVFDVLAGDLRKR